MSAGAVPRGMFGFRWKGEAGLTDEPPSTRAGRFDQTEAVQWAVFPDSRLYTLPINLPRP